MAAKTANVTAKIEQDIKESAEVELKAPKKITTRDAMEDTQFDEVMEKGLLQAKADDSKSAKEVFADLRGRV